MKSVTELELDFGFPISSLDTAPCWFLNMWKRGSSISKEAGAESLAKRELATCIWKAEREQRGF